jgi:hypothetical protein
MKLAATVTRIMGYGFFVNLRHSKQSALCHASELSDDNQYIKVRWRTHLSVCNTTRDTGGLVAGSEPSCQSGWHGQGQGS